MLTLHVTQTLRTTFLQIRNEIVAEEKHILTVKFKTTLT